MPRALRTSTGRAARSPQGRGGALTDCPACCAPEPSGACCWTRGCFSSTEAECLLTPGGLWRGPGTDCGACDGACCHGGVCTQRTIYDCVQSGGQFRGYGVACVPGVTCVAPPSCCFANPPSRCSVLPNTSASVTVTVTVSATLLKSSQAAQGCGVLCRQMFGTATRTFSYVAGPTDALCLIATSAVNAGDTERFCGFSNPVSIGVSAQWLAEDAELFVTAFGQSLRFPGSCGGGSAQINQPAPLVWDPVCGEFKLINGVATATATVSGFTGCDGARPEAERIVFEDRRRVLVPGADFDAGAGVERAIASARAKRGCLQCGPSAGFVETGGLTI